MSDLLLSDSSLLKQLQHWTVPGASALNAGIERAFLQHQDDESVRRSHYFGGRHENIYLGKELVPGLAALLEQIKEKALAIIQQDNPQQAPAGLKMGFWFNAMQPGDFTQPHVHDDYDELLSAVYYVAVPENSGMLRLMEAAQTIEIQPVAGRCVFFPPQLLHEVSCNTSQQLRLSIGMNFGPAGNKQ